jgi:hypothetical protein
MLDISDRLHNNLLKKLIHKKILPAAATKPSNRKAPLAPNAANINALQAKSILVLTCVPPTNDQIISPPEPNALEEAIVRAKAISLILLLGTKIVSAIRRCYYRS